jgi:hypothetical protein
MFRVLALLAGAVGLDIVAFGGRYTDAAGVMAVTILRHFGIL